MKKLLLLTLVFGLSASALAGTSWHFGYDSSGKKLFSNYYSTYGYHGSSVRDNNDGSYSSAFTNTSGVWTYANTPSSSNWDGTFAKYE